MVPQVSFAERSRAVQTRLHGFHLPSNAGVAGHLSRFSEVSPVVVFLWGIHELRNRGHRGQTLELFSDLGQHAVDTELWFSGEGFLAHGTQELLAVIPEALQTGLTESVAAGSGDGLDEDLQTDGAGELLLRQDSSRRLWACEGLREKEMELDRRHQKVEYERAGRRKVCAALSDHTVGLLTCTHFHHLE